MVSAKNKDFQEKYAQDIADLSHIEEKNDAKRSLYLFFSFDIVNSTAYKALDYVHWVTVIGLILQQIQSFVIKEMQEATLWRTIGDELIFIVPIRYKEQFSSYIDIIFYILVTMCAKLKDGSFFDELQEEHKQRELIRSQNILSLKGAAWIAIINDNPNAPEPYDCFAKHYQLPQNPQHEIIDFMGNDIDAGFRIKQQTQIRRLTISYELAYLLSKSSDYQSNLHIITYKQLKGIWGEHYYPIIWYYNDKYLHSVSFDNSFFFDEKENNKLVNEYFQNQENPFYKGDIYTILKKICEDLGFNKKFSFIEKIIQNSQNEELNVLEPNFLLKLHCVAICCDLEKKRIFIAKRNSKRSKLPQLWEFGCAKAVIDKSIAQTIQEEYLKDFNIHVEVICDETREDKQPVPLALYEISSNSGKDKGIITIAKIIKEFDIKKIHSEKHETVRWITEDEIDKFDEQSVSDFKNTLHKAFDKIKEYLNENEGEKK